MKTRYSLAIAFLGIILSSCLNSDQAEVVSENMTSKDEKKQVKLNIHLPVVLDSTDYLVYPVGEAIESETSNRFLYKSRDDYSYYLKNLIFEDTQTGKTHLLADKNLKIESFQRLTDPKNRPTDVILYEIVDDDSSEKQRYTATYLSGIDGKNFTRISPEDEIILDYKFILNTDKLYFLTKKKSESENPNVATTIWTVDLGNFKTEKILIKEMNKVLSN